VRVGLVEGAPDFRPFGDGDGLLVAGGGNVQGVPEEVGLAGERGVGGAFADARRRWSSATPTGWFGG
jgi:hypothetical protein